MAILVKAVPTFLMHVFAPVLGVCLAAWFVVLLVSAARGAPQTFGARPRAPRGVVWAGLIALAVACTLYSGKSPNGTNGVQNLPPRPVPPLASLTVPAPSIFDYPRMITETRVASGIALVCGGQLLAKRVENGGIWVAPTWDTVGIAVVLGVFACAVRILVGPAHENQEADVDELA